MSIVSSPMERAPLLTRPVGSLVLRRRPVAQLSNRTNIGRSPIALATTPRAACAAPASSGSSCVTPSIASVTCRVRSAAAFGSRSISRFTSQDTIACIARMVALPCVSSSSLIVQSSLVASRAGLCLQAHAGRASFFNIQRRRLPRPTVLVCSPPSHEQLTMGGFADVQKAFAGGANDER